jgi:hypothetical protein
VVGFMLIWIFMVDADQYSYFVGLSIDLTTLGDFATVLKCECAGVNQRTCPKLRLR